MIILSSERYYNTVTKTFYEIRPIFYINNRADFEIYHREREDQDWVYETKKCGHTAAVDYIKKKGV